MLPSSISVYIYKWSLMARTKAPRRLGFWVPSWPSGHMLSVRWAFSLNAWEMVDGHHEENQGEPRENLSFSSFAMSSFWSHRICICEWEQANSISRCFYDRLWPAYSPQVEFLYVFFMKRRGVFRWDDVAPRGQPVRAEQVRKPCPIRATDAMHLWLCREGAGAILK